MEILFCNIGWMEFYRGLTPEDKIVGGGSYVKDEGMGHEVCNFADHLGMVYGYVQPPKADGQPGEGQINIDRLGSQGKDIVKGVLVVWTASRPERGTVVVGWYKNATVHRFYQRYKTAPKLHRENNLHGFRIEAKKSDVTLLPIDQRTCFIPRRIKGSMGQSNVWFAAAPESRPIVKEVMALISGKRTRPSFRRARKTDPEHNAKVEKSAVGMTRRYYEMNSYVVESVEKDNVGWDLEATSGKLKLLIEVKGLSGSIASAQLSPNEYIAFASQSSNYRLAIVTDALTYPQLVVCRYSKEDGSWVVDGNEKYNIDIQTKESAIVQVRF
jgi:hypothetical protein